MPGFTLSTFRCSSVYISTYFLTSGLGPTRLMSPFTTFSSWGSSSSLYLRMKWPMRVMRLSSSPMVMRLSRSESVRIERNLYSPKGLPPSPIRSCTKNPGPLLVSLISSQSTRNSGERTISPIAEKSMSKNRIKANCQLSIIHYPFFKISVKF